MKHHRRRAEIPFRAVIDRLSTIEHRLESENDAHRFRVDREVVRVELLAEPASDGRLVEFCCVRLAEFEVGAKTIRPPVRDCDDAELHGGYGRLAARTEGRAARSNAQLAGPRSLRAPHTRRLRWRAMEPQDVSRHRLLNSGLLGKPFATAEDVVRWHGAMQAQDLGMAKWSVGQRRAGAAVDGDLDDALARGAIVRTHVLRPTWHFVAGEDLKWLLALTGPRVQQQNRRRYQELGLDERTLGRCRELIASELQGGNQLTRKEIAILLDGAGIDTSGQRIPYILMDCELEGVICSGGLRGAQHTYASVDERVPCGTAFDRDEALVELTRRYLTSHGPATVRDLRWWSGLTVADIRNALDGLGSKVASETIEDRTFWSIAPADGHASIVTGAHLLQAYDEFVVGYRESRYFGDPRAATARAAWSTRALPSGVVLLNDKLGGHWRRRSTKARIAIEVVAYEEANPAEVRALRIAASQLGRFLGRKATLEVFAI